MDFKKFEEFKKEKAECNRKLREAVEVDEMKEALECLSVVKNLEGIDERKISVTFEQVPGKPSIVGIHGKPLDLAFAVCQIMDYDESFYEVLKFVCHCRRIQELGAFKVINDTKIDCENEEQKDLMRELYKKSPEELEKIKEELKK